MLPVCLLSFLTLVSVQLAVQGETITLSVTDCDVLIAGGSLSALAAAITAANISASRTNSQSVICLLEPTDWAGGQLTSSNVPPDIVSGVLKENFPSSFLQLLEEASSGEWNSNPGHCWVSVNCFEAANAVAVVKKWLEAFSPFLRVYYNTVVSATTATSTADRKPKTIRSVSAVQRISKSTFEPWTVRLSHELTDWYSHEDSPAFSKRILEFSSFQVLIEATEFSDVLMTSGVSVAQGVESPSELSEEYQSGCGQSTVLPFVVSYDSEPFSTSNVPQGKIGGESMGIGELTWAQAWTYRRTKAIDVGNNTDPLEEPSVTMLEKSNQNLDNDFTEGYIFQPLIDVSSHNWTGGIDLVTLALAENRSYAYYHYVRGKCLVDLNHDSSSECPECSKKSQCDQNKPPVDIRQYLALNYSEVGTQHGLAKVPYLRDSRRSQFGLFGFRLTYSDLSTPYGQGGLTTMPFPDTVGLGYYPYADIHRLSEDACTYPTYLDGINKPLLPYYIPFRALTSMDADNLLVSGKSMAQTFLANAGTRLHPSEWASGVAAGAASVLMIEKKWLTTERVYENVEVLQALLQSDEVKSPLRWTL